MKELSAKETGTILKSLEIAPNTPEISCDRRCRTLLDAASQAALSCFLIENSSFPIFLPNLLVHPIFEMLFGNDQSAPDTKRRKILLVHQLVNAGFGQAQDLGKIFGIEEQRKLIVVLNNGF